MSKLKDRIVIVTGAAQGMGRAIANEGLLARIGLAFYMTDPLCVAFDSTLVTAYWQPSATRHDPHARVGASASRAMRSKRPAALRGDARASALTRAADYRNVTRSKQGVRI